MSNQNVISAVPELIERASKQIGDFVRTQGLGVNDCATLFTVLAVRCAKLAGANREQFLNYAAQMYDDKSDISSRQPSLIQLI